MKKVKTYIYPANDTDNDFFKSLTAALQANNINISNRLTDFCQTDIFLLHWYENVYKHQFPVFIKKCVFLWALRICRKHTIVYLHNIQPHRKYLHKVDYTLSSILQKMLIRYSSKLVLLSESSMPYFSPAIRHALTQAEDKIHYIPHPNFVDLYHPLPKKTTSDKLRLLSFGGIELYKGTKIAIEAMNCISNDKIELWIIGNAPKERQTALKMLSTNSNTHFVFQYIKNEDVAEMFSHFDLCVYPLDTSSCLNSSSVLLSFSLQTSVICPHIATLDDYTPTNYISYSYTSRTEHINTLAKLIQKAYADKQKDATLFVQTGEKCYQEVIEKNSQALITQRIGSIVQ